MAGEAGTALVVEIAKKTIQPAVDATVRHVGYLINYKSNINNLKERAKDLKTTRLDAEYLWDSSANNNEEASHTSVAWLDKVKAAETAAYVIKEATEKQKTGCLSKGCLNLKQRYVLSRNAVKKAEEIMQLQIKGKGYISSTKPALPPSKLTGALANDDSKEFKTRSKIMNDVMEALKDDKISIIGLCGTGGVGKTTLMHELRERVKVNGLFHEVVMTTVSQNPDLSDIRCKIAEMLGLAGVKDKKNDIAVADEIHKRLAGKGRRTLVILDDIWNEISLEGLGIPVGRDETYCKVVLTSRQFGVCTQMKAHTTIPVAVMPPGEAWYLFRMTAGDCVEIDNLQKIARKVAGECGGLPIALVTLGKALSNKDINIWRDAHFQLKEHSVTRIPDMDKKVYSSIKMSFDFLAIEQPEAMPLLSLCCQHPEDAAIQVENLAKYCLALRLFKNVYTLAGVRDIVCSLIVHLKSFFFLETVNADDDFDSNERVKMHDIIRDVGLKEDRDKIHMQIGKQLEEEEEEEEEEEQEEQEEEEEVYKSGTSEAVDYPNLKILVQSGVDCRLLNESFLSQMKELRVLEYYLENGQLQVPAIEVLTNLRMLSLQCAIFGEDTLSQIGRLTKLELLSFRGCRIGSFPRQIGQLSDLKLLDLRLHAIGLHTIPRGILPELKKLEEVYFGEFFFKGAPEDGEEGIEGESHGSIAELENLSNLKVLQIKLLNPTELLGLLLRFKKLQRYYFGMVGEPDSFYSFERSLILREVSVEWIVGDKIESTVSRTEKLRLSMIDGWSDPLKIEKFVSLRELELRKCEHLEYLVCGNSSVFRKLERLELEDMSGLKELCHNGDLTTGSLGKLRVLRLHELPEMRHLWVGPTDSLCLFNLTNVEITGCGALECIFPHSAAKCLVQLQELTVRDCGMLKGIVSKGEGIATGRGGEIVEEPTNVDILHFPKLIAITIDKSSILQGFYNLDDDYVQPLLTPLVMLPRMGYLSIYRSDQLKQIVGCGTVDISKFTAIDWLQNLGSITVQSCASLESVFDFEGMAENSHVVTLGKLEIIHLQELPNLTHIFRCRMQHISTPHLWAITVYSCHKLENLIAYNLIKLLQNLNQVILEDCKTLETVFDFQGLDLEVMGKDARPILCKLQFISLKKLPRLEHVCRLTPEKIHVFQNLGNLNVEDCDRLAYLFSSTMARVLEKLQNLNIRNCKSLKESITVNEEHVEKKIVFRSLSTILLENLDKLSSFCSSEQLEFEFPSLEKVSIVGCPEMKMFCYGRLSAEKLHGVEFASWGGKPEWKGDLNQTVQHFNARVNQMSSDGVGDYIAADIDEIYVPGVSVHDEYIHSGDEATSSNPMNALLAPLAASSPDASFVQFVAFPHLNDSRVQYFNFLHLDLNEDNSDVATAADDEADTVANNVDDSDVDEISPFDLIASAEDCDGDGDGNVQCSNEGTSATSNPTKALLATFPVSSTPDASLAQLVASPHLSDSRGQYFNLFHLDLIEDDSAVATAADDDNEAMTVTDNVDDYDAAYPFEDEISLFDLKVSEEDCYGDEYVQQCVNEGTSASLVQFVAFPRLSDSRLQYFNFLHVDLNEDNSAVATAADDDDEANTVADTVDEISLFDLNVSAEDCDDDENDQEFVNEVLDHSSSTQPEQVQHSLSADLTKIASPSLPEVIPTTSTERPLHSSDTSMKTKVEKQLSDSLSSPDDGESNRILIQGVYIKSNMKTNFEEILTSNPNFLSAFRVKTEAVKTALVETAIHSLQILSQANFRRISSEQLVYVRNSLDDLVASGLDVGWLERDYERASIVLDEETVVLGEVELGRLESEVKKDAYEAKEKMEAFQMAKEKLNATTALRDDFKAKLDALKQGLEDRKQLLDNGFD